MRAEAAQGEKGKSVIVKSVLFYTHHLRRYNMLNGSMCASEKDKGKIGAFSQTSAEIPGICHYHCPA